MAKLRRVMNALFFRRTLKRWRDVARLAETTELSRLRRQRTRAELLDYQLAEVIAAADQRLALPHIGSEIFSRPRDADWAWRPMLWRRPIHHKGMVGARNGDAFSDEAKVFHDCPRSELVLRQFRNSREEDMAPFSVRMEVYDFDGSFLSIAVALPDEALKGLRRKHLVRMDITVETEEPIELFARLNVRHGPNNEQIVREVDLRSGSDTVEFDLGYSNINEKRLESAWVDLIFERARMNQITIRDLTFCRRPRAEL